jgi:hypothetical protein
MNVKFDYRSEEFLRGVEELAASGLSDGEIANALVVKFGEKLSKRYWKTVLDERGEDGELTAQAQGLQNAIAKGRSVVNLDMRKCFASTVMGGKTIRTIERTFSGRPCECRGKDKRCEMCDGTGVIPNHREVRVMLREEELPPNLVGMEKWLVNHDPDFRKATIEAKKLDVTTCGEKITGIQIIDNSGGFIPSPEPKAVTEEESY